MTSGRRDIFLWQMILLKAACLLSESVDVTLCSVLYQNSLSVCLCRSKVKKSIDECADIA